MTPTPGAVSAAAVESGVPMSHPSKITSVPTRLTPVEFSTPNASCGWVKTKRVGEGGCER